MEHNSSGNLLQLSLFAFVLPQEQSSSWYKAQYWTWKMDIQCFTVEFWQARDFLEHPKNPLGMKGPRKDSGELIHYKQYYKDVLVPSVRF